MKKKDVICLSLRIMMVAAGTGIFAGSFGVGLAIGRSIRGK